MKSEVAACSQVAFGTGEGGLIQVDGNPAGLFSAVYYSLPADMLYDNNFLVRNLREAYFATNDSFYSDAEVTQ